jgi:hypothetical protein
LIILTVTLYILGILLALLLMIVLLILLVPIRYKVQANYEQNIWFGFWIRCTPAFILTGAWDDRESMPLKVKFILCGIPLSIDPDKTDKKEKAKKEKKERKKKGFKTTLAIIDKDLRVRGIALIKDLLQILKPDLFSVKGKIGFDEPHLTGWLAAINSTLKYSCKKTFVAVEPVWGEEYYELEALLKGRLIVGFILVKVGWFFFKIQTRHLFNRPGKSNLAPAA